MHRDFVRRYQFTKRVVVTPDFYKLGRLPRSAGLAKMRHVIFLCLLGLSTYTLSQEGSLDIDGDGDVSMLTDGMLLLRSQLGFANDALIKNALGAGATLVTGGAVQSQINTMGDRFDIDGNGRLEALSDGLLVMRYLSDRRGSALIRDVIGENANRTTAAQVEAHIASLMPVPPPLANTVGSGRLGFEGAAALKGSSINVYFYIPDDVTADTPLLFAFHPLDRNARDTRNALIDKARAYRFIVVAPEFSSSLFPGGDGYNLGNVFVDGDNPSAGTLNDESEWSFSVVEPLFDYMKYQLGNQTSNYSVYGKSAGAQHALRMLMFKPNARINQIVVAGAGWYTTIDDQTKFPYGSASSPLEAADLSVLFAEDLTVLVGEYDRDPDASNLRHNSVVDRQGLHRLSRAQFFYNQAQTLAFNLDVEFRWRLVILANAGHSTSAYAEEAADLLFQSP